jgi:hypothetical protein
LWQLQAMQEEEQEDVEMEQAGEDNEQGDTEARSSTAGESVGDHQDSEEVPDEQAVEAFTVRMVISLSLSIDILPTFINQIKPQELLSESDISPFATWEMELPKFIGDQRYKGNG